MITTFDGPYRYLSNFYAASFVASRYGDTVPVSWPTAEHLFQASKTHQLAEVRAIWNAATPRDAKRLGRQCTLRGDWEGIKLRVMFDVAWAKFVHLQELGEKLISTTGHVLVEGNTWHDNYWGMCMCWTCRNAQLPGHNHLGRTLMAVRRLLAPDEMDLEAIRNPPSCCRGLDAIHAV
jgi:hypothetical protein